MTLEGLILYLLRPLMLCKGSKNAPIQLSGSHMSDEEIIEACQSATAIDANTYYIAELDKTNPGCIFLIAHDTVVKRTHLSPSELDIAELKHLVMQYIEGKTLHELWDSMSWWMRFRVALTIRYYVHQLRSLPARLNLSRPGPVGDYKDLYCDGRLFSEPCPPERFDSYSSLAFYYDECLFVQKWAKKQDNIAPFDRSRPLAVVHQDFHLRNLVLSRDGQLWVLDWGMAGVYPDWFEYANMAIFSKSNSEVPQSWKWLIPYMFGKFEAPGQLPFIYTISHVSENMPPDFYDVACPL
ncbi:hypothetical protein AX16_007504 [Volvariella volvacea WC 439]|nr:hypothetical protein AX16_007504 [Volvariella volvacea WC 439]